MYNLRVYLKGVSKVKDPSKIVNGKKVPGKTKLFNTLSFRKIAKKDGNRICSWWKL